MNNLKSRKITYRQNFLQNCSITLKPNNEIFIGLISVLGAKDIKEILKFSTRVILTRPGTKPQVSYGNLYRVYETKLADYTYDTSTQDKQKLNAHSIDIFLDA